MTDEEKQDDPLDGEIDSDDPEEESDEEEATE
jgi:hypothetical protein